MIRYIKDNYVFITKSGTFDILIPVLDNYHNIVGTKTVRVNVKGTNVESKYPVEQGYPFGRFRPPVYTIRFDQDHFGIIVLRNPRTRYFFKPITNKYQERNPTRFFDPIRYIVSDPRYIDQDGNPKVFHVYKSVSKKTYDDIIDEIERTVHNGHDPNLAFGIRYSTDRTIHFVLDRRYYVTVFGNGIRITGPEGKCTCVNDRIINLFETFDLDDHRYRLPYYIYYIMKVRDLPTRVYNLYDVDELEYLDIVRYRW
jgi:hypothetical protein